jgi:hypothetical protein
MLVDMNFVVACMVVSSRFFSGRLPINRNAPEHFSLIGKLQKLLVSGDCDRCAASFTGGSNV